MVHHNPGAFFKTPDARPLFYHLAAGFVPGDYVLVAFGALSRMFPVNGPYVASADGAGFGLYQNLPVARLGNGYVLENYRTVSGEIRPFHRSFHK
jgi:hypothetical protein